MRDFHYVCAGLATFAVFMAGMGLVDTGTLAAFAASAGCAILWD